MKKIAILFLATILSVTPCAHARQIANVLPKNNGGMLQPLIEGTFNPGRPTDVPQDFISYAGGLGSPVGSAVTYTSDGQTWDRLDIPAPSFAGAFYIHVGVFGYSSILSYSVF